MISTTNLIASTTKHVLSVRKARSGTGSERPEKPRETNSLKIYESSPIRIHKTAFFLFLWILLCKMFTDEFAIQSPIREKLPRSFGCIRYMQFFFRIQQVIYPEGGFFGFFLFIYPYMDREISLVGAKLIPFDP